MSESKEIVDLINDLFEDSKYFLNEAKKILRILKFKRDIIGR